MTPTFVSAPAKRAAAKKAPKTLGALPEWNLADLYPSMEAPAVKADLDKLNKDLAALKGTTGTTSTTT